MPNTDILLIPSHRHPTCFFFFLSPQSPVKRVPRCLAKAPWAWEAGRSGCDHLKPLCNVCVVREIVERVALLGAPISKCLWGAKAHVLSFRVGEKHAGGDACAPRKKRARFRAGAALPGAAVNAGPLRAPRRKELLRQRTLRSLSGAYTPPPSLKNPTQSSHCP